MLPTTSNGKSSRKIARMLPDMIRSAPCLEVHFRHQMCECEKKMCEISRGIFSYTCLFD